MKPLLRKILSAPEFSILAVPSFLCFAAACGALAVSGGRGWLEVSRKSLTLVNLLGGHKLFLFFLAVCLARAGAWLYYRAWRDPVSAERSARALRTFAPLWLFAALLGFFWSFSTLALYHLVPPLIVKAKTLALDNFERNLFGTLPGFALLRAFSGSFLEKTVLSAYKYFFVLSSAAAWLITLGSLKNLRKTVFAYMLAYAAAFPFWVLLPVTSPDGVYYGNVFGPMPGAAMPGIPLSDLSGFFVRDLFFFHRVWIGDPAFLNVSSLPSLHMAWCVVLAFYLYRTRTKYAFPAFLWVCLTGIGTVYSLQHYATDMFCGVLFAGIVILATEKIFRREDGKAERAAAGKPR